MLKDVIRNLTGPATAEEIKDMDREEMILEMKRQRQETEEQLNTLRGKLGLSKDSY